MGGLLGAPLAVVREEGLGVWWQVFA